MSCRAGGRSPCRHCRKDKTFCRQTNTPGRKKVPASSSNRGTAFPLSARGWGKGKPGASRPPSIYLAATFPPPRRLARRRGGGKVAARYMEGGRLAPGLPLPHPRADSGKAVPRLEEDAGTFFRPGVFVCRQNVLSLRQCRQGERPPARQDMLTKRFGYP